MARAFEGIRPLAIFAGFAVGFVASLPLMAITSIALSALVHQPGDLPTDVAGRIRESYAANAVTLAVGSITDLIAGFIAARLGSQAPYKNGLLAGICIIAVSVRVPAIVNAKIGTRERSDRDRDRSEATLSDGVQSLVAFSFRRDAPLSSIRWALCTTRSQIESATVGSLM